MGRDREQAFKECAVFKAVDIMLHLISDADAGAIKGGDVHLLSGSYRALGQNAGICACFAGAQKVCHRSLLADMRLKRRTWNAGLCDLKHRVVDRNDVANTQVCTSKVGYQKVFAKKSQI